MDNSVSSWFSELGMDDPHFDEQFDITDFFDEELSAALGEDFHSTLFPAGNTCSSTLIPTNSSTTNLSALSAMEAPLASTEKQIEQQKSKGSSSSNNLNQPCCSPMILTFGNPVTPHINIEDAAKVTQKKKKSGGRVRPASQTYDHIVAERRRREHLSQRFVALSAMVPGLKKMDKTSVLGDAINYLKHLQERVIRLEEQAANQTSESVVLVRRSQLLVEDEGSSDEMGVPDEQPLPEIEAKVSNKNVLLRVHCENHRGVLVKILSELEKLNLAVINTNVSQFGRLALDITVIAEMDKEFNLTMQELVRSLRSVVQRVTQDNKTQIP